MLVLSWHSLCAPGGVIGDDAGEFDGTVNSATTVYTKLEAIRDLIDDTLPAVKVVAGIQKIVGQPNVLTQVDFGLIGDTSQSPTLSGETDIYGKLDAFLTKPHDVIYAKWATANAGPAYPNNVPATFQELIENINNLV